jgi:DNA-binding transcriptional ArsR family regulator
MEMTNALQVLSGLAHAKRLAIFRELVEAGPDGRVAGDLAARVGLPGATLSFHLRELGHARLVESEQKGRFVCYRANFDAMNDLIGYLTLNCCRDSGAQCAPAAGCAPKPLP